MDTRIRPGMPSGSQTRKESQDDIIKRQLDTIGKLVNSNLMSLADELWLGNTKTIRETDKDDKIIPFPGKWHSD